MSRQQHSIQKLTVDVRFPSREGAYPLQDRISDLYRNKLQSLLGAVLDELVSEDLIVKFDTLPVDLGTIALNKIEEELPEKLRESLYEQLAGLLAFPENGSGLQNSDPHFSAFKAGYLEVMEYFLLTGGLPWWAAGEQMKDPAGVLEILLREHAAAFRLLLMRAGQFSYVRRRIAYQFSESAIRSVIEVLEPEQAAFIFEYHHAIVAVQQAKQPVKSEAAELKKAVYEFVLTYLLMDRGNEFNRKAFVKSTLGQMARHFNLQYEEILELFAAPLIEKEDPPGSTPRLVVIIRELFTERQTAGHPVAGIPHTGEEERGAGRPEAIAQIAEWIRYYFFSGSFPPAAGEYDEKKLGRDFLALMRTAPEAARRLITGFAGRPEAIRRMASVGGSPGLAAIIRFLEPANADFILAYLQLATLLHRKKKVAVAARTSFLEESGQLVLEFLLPAIPVIFDAGVFLEANIREISRRLNLSFRHTIAILIQAIGEENNEGVDSRLFHLLTGLLRGLRESPVPEAPGEPEGWLNTGGKDNTAPGEQQEQPPDKGRRPGLRQEDFSEFFKKRNLFDLLRFWIRYGYLPWWEKEQTPESPAAIWEKLAAGSPAEISWLMQFAGTEEQNKQRLAWQLPLSLLLDAFRLFPEGGRAVRLLESLEQFLENIPELKLKERNTIPGLLVIALWEGFEHKDYRGFSQNAFVLRSIRQLSRWTGVYPGDIYRAMIKALFREEGKKAYPESLAAAIRSLTGRRWSSPEISGGGEQEEREGGIDIRRMIDRHLELPEGGLLREEAILLEGLRLLEYYLRHNRLPGRFAALSSLLQDIFLRKLLQLLIREKKKELKQILESTGNHAEAGIHLQDVFYEDRSGQDKEVKELIFSFRERDLLRYLESLAGDGSRYNGEKIAEMLKRILHSFSEGMQKNRIIRVLHSPLLAGLLAEKLTEEEMYKLAEQTGWSKTFLRFLQEWQRLFAEAVKDLPDKWTFHAWFRKQTLFFLSGKEEGNSMEKYLQEFLSGIIRAGFSSRTDLYSALLKKVCETPLLAGSVLNSLMPAFRERLRQLKAEEERRAKIKKKLERSDQKMLSQAGIRGLMPGQEEESERIAAELKRKQEAEESAKKEALKKALRVEDATAYVKNAGLVLLHPFLFTYYTRLGLMEKTEFVDENARQRAAHLLQYLVDETTIHPEQEMVLNKILCGMEPEDPLTLEIDLTPLEAQVSQELLQAVATRWEKMKNTSLQGFRASFLQREGALFPMNDAWKLRVDQRGYDILLQTLPWTFGMVRASWMKKIIYVEWI